MSRTIRLVILGVFAVVLIFLGKDKVRVPLDGLVSPAHGQPIQLQAPPTLVPTQAAPPTVQQDPSLAAAYGLVWNDLDHDGLQSLREPGLRNVTVKLLTSSRSAAGTAVTDATGAYRFEGLVPGDYIVSVVVPTGYVLSPKDQGVNELVDSDADPLSAEITQVMLVAGENYLVWTTGLYSPTAAVQADPGTVQPPPTGTDACSPGVYPLGGITTLRVNRLAPGYCLHAFLWRPAFAIGRIPDSAGRILAEVTFLEIYYQDLFTYRYEVPGETNSIQVCYALPQGRTGQIYFFDYYGPRFGQRTGQPGWVLLNTTVQGGIACAVSQTSGAYALIGQ